MSKVGVVLLNAGEPNSLGAAEKFFYNQFNDCEFINFPLGSFFREEFAKIMSMSRSRFIKNSLEANKDFFINFDIANRQAEKLKEELWKNFEVKIFNGMRYWHPYINEALNQIEREFIEEIILLPLYPQFCSATTGSSFNEWDRKLEKRGDLRYLRTEKIESFHEFVPYIEAVVERINEGLDRFQKGDIENVHLVFVAKSVPKGFIKKGNLYEKQVEETVAKVLEVGSFRQPVSISFQANIKSWNFLRPLTNQLVEDLAKHGTKRMLLTPISSVVDDFEITNELNFGLRQTALSKGVEQFEITEGLNDSETFIKALAKLVLQTKTMTKRRRKIAISNMGF